MTDALAAIQWVGVDHTWVERLFPGEKIFPVHRGGPAGGSAAWKQSAMLCCQALSRA
jgi:hypothetical protein